jgi:hypothetical protein
LNPAQHPFVAQDKRTTPIDVHYARFEEDQVVYHLPSGFSVESMPQPTNASMAAKGDAQDRVYRDRGLA